MIEVEIKGLDKFSAMLNRLSGSLRSEVMSKALYAGAVLLEGYAKANVTEMRAVDTGFLRSSIYATSKAGSTYAERTSEARGLRPDEPLAGEAQTTVAMAVVACAAEYGPYVEYGTSRMTGRPFMRQAIDGHRDDVTKAIADNLANELGKAGV